MKRALVTVLGILLVAAGAAVLWPRAPKPPKVPETSLPAAPRFEAVEVSSAVPSFLAVSGTVRDAFGKPIAGAEVFLSASAQKTVATAPCDVCGAPLLSCQSHRTVAQVAELLHTHQGEQAPGARTTTDAEGRFRFENLVGVSFTVWAQAPGHGAAVHERAAPNDPVDLYLPQPRRVSGRVLDEARAPVGGATVFVLSRRLPLPVTVRTASDGSFEAGGLGEGPFYVLAEREGFLPRAEPFVEAGPNPVELRLSRPRVLEVEVRKGGEPVDARVRLTGDHLNVGAPSPGGLARIEGLPSDEVQVGAELGSFSAAPQRVELRAPVTRVRVDLVEGGTLAVTLVDGEGQPVPDAELTLLRADGIDQVFHQKAKPGELVMVGPLPVGHYLVRASAEGFRASEQPVRIVPGETAVEVVLQRGVFIRGRVLDEYGRPAPGISVLVSPTGDVTHADEEGRFAAQVPSPGFYELQAHHSDWGGGEAKVTAPAENVELQLEPKAGIQVTVLAEGRRLEGADVVLWAGEGSWRNDRPSGSDGVVLMRGMPPGAYTLIAGHRDYLASERRQVELRDGELVQLEVSLEPGATLEGEVVDDSGAPVAGASVIALPRGAEPTLTDSNGRFSLKPLQRERSYRLEVHQSGYDQRERVVASPGGAPARIVLHKRSVFRGRVVSDSGGPVTSFRVDDQDVVSPDGRFELPLMTEAGKVFAIVEAEGYQPEMIDRPAEQTELGEIRLVAEPKVQGRVVDERGAPVDGAGVSCDMCNGQVTSNADGTFELSIPARVGAVTVLAKRGSLSGTVRWNVGGNEPLEVSIRASVHLTGHIYAADGRPSAGTQVEAVHVERSEPFSFVTMQDGSYAVDLPEGSYRFNFGAERRYAGEPMTFVRISGTQMQLDFGPGPSTGQLVVELEPAPGYALCVVRGDLSPNAALPMALFKAEWAQMMFQPKASQTVLKGLPPGRYTVVWWQLNAVGAASPPPVMRTVDVPGTRTVSLRAP